MEEFSTSLPIILFSYKILKDSPWVDRYLKGVCSFIKVNVPMTLLMSLLVIHLGGFECLSHFQKQYASCLSVINGNFTLFCVDRLRDILLLVPGSMITWKIFLLQRRLVDQYAPSLTSIEYSGAFKNKPQI